MAIQSGEWSEQIRIRFGIREMDSLPDQTVLVRTVELGV